MSERIEYYGVAKIYKDGMVVMASNNKFDNTYHAGLEKKDLERMGAITPTVDRLEVVKITKECGTYMDDTTWSHIVGMEIVKEGE